MSIGKNRAVEREERERQLINGAIPGLFLKYALPGVIGLLFIGIQSVIDGIVLGHYVGANALASVSLVLPCYSLMTAVAIMIGVGSQTIVGISLGCGDRREANDAVTSLFIALTGFSILISVLFYLFAESLSRLLGANEVLIGESIDYIRSLAPFFPVLTLMFFGDYMLKAVGRPIYSMTVMALTVILNIVLDILFVVVLGWGITGAGLSTGLAFTLGAICNVPQLFNPHQVIAVQRGRFRLRLVWNALYNGSSEGMSELSVGVTVFLFNITMMKYLGEDGVAAFTAINYVQFIATTVFLGISDGIIPIISYNFGAKQYVRIRSVLKLAVKTNMLIGTTLFMILFFFGNHIITLFFKGEEAPHALEIATYGVSIYSFAFLMNGLNILSSSYFTAIGNAKISVIISLLRGLIFVTFGILVYPPLFGITGIWFDVPVAELCTLSISCWLVLRSIKKYRKKESDGQLAEEA